MTLDFLERNRRNMGFFCIAAMGIGWYMAEHPVTKGAHPFDPSIFVTIALYCWVCLSGLVKIFMIVGKSIRKVAYVANVASGVLFLILLVDRTPPSGTGWSLVTHLFALVSISSWLLVDW